MLFKYVILFVSIKYRYIEQMLETMSKSQITCTVKFFRLWNDKELR